MAIHWQVKFKTLRAASLLTANIYDDTYSGSPLQLKGGAVPFETQEDDTDDMFTPIRTQSGYLRIVDDGTAMNSSNQSVAFNWRDFIPTTDTDRPVTLTDSNNNVLWQGFLQAQNFGAALYESPQERDFPLQCSLTVLECADINYDQKEIKNFAYLLQQIVGSIPATCRPSSFYVQGGADAQTWLLKCLDWQNFVNEESDEGTLEARFTMYEALEMMCRFWGWTARTMGTALYLTCADDTDEQTWLSLTAANLATMAGGTSAGTTSAAPSAVAIPGDIFGSVNNQDFQLRGPNKVDITADTNTADEYIIDPMDDQLVKDMKATAWQDGTLVGTDVHYTEDILSIDRNFCSGTAMPDLASFNVEYKLESDGQVAFHWNEIGPVIRIIQSYSNGIAFVSLVTKYEHLFADGFFRLEGEVYRQGEIYNSTSDGFFAGNGYMQMRLGIGKTRNSATWWDGQQWTNSITEFKATIGNRDEEIYTLYWPDQSVANAKETNIIAVGSTGLSGLLFVELLGSNSQVVTDISGQKCFDIKNFRVRFTKNNTVTKQGLSDSEPFPNSGYWMISEIDDLPKPVYKAQNNNNLRENLSESVDVCSERQMHLGWGIVLNPANTYMSEIAYGGVNAHPEQHLADRIVNLWSTSKRRIDCELLTHDGSAATVAASLTPQNKVSIDGSTMYPVAISHNWRDDLTQIKMIELGAVPTLAYITDGLVFHLDGIDKGATAGSWTDLINGVVLAGTNVISTQYGWSFDGSAYFSGDHTLTGTSDYTLEICFKPTVTDSYCILAINGNTKDNIIFYKSSNTITFLQRENTYTMSLSANSNYSVSLNLDQGMLNGAKVTKNQSTDYWYNSSTFYVGRRSNGQYFTGNIYSIRLYNRRLTEAEQLNNFNVDNARFNLGL